MTRKKYIKLLMGLGKSRNTANAMARACQVAGKPYAKAYRERVRWLQLVQAARRFYRNMTKAAMALAESARHKLQGMQLHHPTPYSPENVGAPLDHNVQIVTPAEHAALHGYRAHTVLVDELAGHGGGGND